MRKLFALILAFALCLGCLSVPALAEGPAKEDLIGTWYVESLKDETYPDVVFSGTNLSGTLTFEEDGMLRLADPYTEEMDMIWRLEGNTIYTTVWREGVDTVLAEGDGIEFATIEDGKIVTTYTNSGGEIEYTTYYTREPARYVIAEKKTDPPVAMEDVEGTWRIAYFGLENTLVSAEDFGFEGTAEIRDCRLVMHLKLSGEDQERESTQEFDPEIKYDALYTATDTLAYRIEPRTDGTLLYTIGFGTVLWVFEPME